MDSVTDDVAVVGAAILGASFLPTIRQTRQRFTNWRADRAYSRGVKPVPGVMDGTVPARERTATLEREIKGIKGRLGMVERVTTETHELVKQLVGETAGGNSLASVIERMARQSGVWQEPQDSNSSEHGPDPVP